MGKKVEYEYMGDVTFQTITDKEKAREIWKVFSPHKTIDDEFAFRDTWTEDLSFPFHFIVGYDQERPIGLLALQQNTIKGLGPKLLQMETSFLEFFAGIDTDDNGVYILPGYKTVIPQFYAQITSAAVLTSLKEQVKVGEREAIHYLDRYELDLTEFANFEDILQKNLDGKSRQRLINRTNRIEKSYLVEVKKATVEDLPTLFNFSIERFGERSSFHMKDRQKIYYDLFSRFTVDLFLILLDDAPKAISFGIVHNQIYTTVNIGYDYLVRDLSKYLVVTQLKRALTLGCQTFDAGQGDNGWKEHFNLRKIPQYKLALNTLV
ncbi:hypothetical protein BH11PAT1_BH11PAT1_5760 [soil metagenome]